MRGHVRTLGHETNIAKIAAVRYLPVFCFLHPIQFAGASLIYVIKQRRKRRAQVYATAATMTDVKDALHLVE